MSENEHYKFFSHRSCEFFPCHSGADPDRFNCLGAVAATTPTRWTASRIAAAASFRTNRRTTPLLSVATRRSWRSSKSKTGYGLKNEKLLRSTCNCWSVVVIFPS